MEDIGGAVEAFCRHDGNSRKSVWGQRFKSLLIKRVLPVKRLNDLRSRVNSLPNETAIPDRILEVLGVTYEISANDLARTPSEGPLVVVANHPFGAIEGLILASILLKTRGDTKVMANYLLSGLVTILLGNPQALRPWAMGIAFGVGQTIVAAVLYRNAQEAGDEA